MENDKPMPLMDTPSLETPSVDMPGQPMDAPTPVLLVLAAVCILGLVALMLIDVIWLMTGPATAADPVSEPPAAVRQLQEQSQPAPAMPAPAPPPG